MKKSKKKSQTKKSGKKLTPKKELISLAKKAEFLGAARQKEILDNVDWMTESEIEYLIKSIKSTGKVIEANEAKFVKKLQKVEKAVIDFRREELPKIIKAREKEEAKGEKEEAERLLKGF